jgi:serine O-acetyltransferase
MFDNLRADLQAAAVHRTLERGLLRVLTRVETPAIIGYRFSHWVTRLRIPIVRPLLMIPALIWQRLNQMFLGIYISPDAEIGPGLVIHTPYGIFVAPVKIGANCTLSTGTLISSSCKSVGDNVYFGAGCKIIGDAKIGNNVVIVANSVVLTDVPDNITIMGVPARIKLPGGKAKRFPWRALDRKQEQKPSGANGQGVNGHGTNGAKPSSPGNNGSAGANLPAVDPTSSHPETERLPR